MVEPRGPGGARARCARPGAVLQEDVGSVHAAGRLCNQAVAPSPPRAAWIRRSQPLLRDERLIADL